MKYPQNNPDKSRRKVPTGGPGTQRTTRPATDRKRVPTGKTRR